MNKIIIIGNGFDLAHGLKTSYNDFISDYIKKICLGSITPHIYRDDLIESRTSYTPNSFDPKLYGPIDYLEFYYANEGKFNIKSNFLRSLLNDRKQQKWVDIENTFLQKLFNLIKIEKKHVDIEEIIGLNHDLELIKLNLFEYLIKEIDRFNFGTDSRYIDLFISGINRNPTENITFINFNYTNTVEAYIHECLEALYKKFKSDQVKHKINLINIHGTVKVEKQNIIFGIGDEYHEMYNKIKDYENIHIILKNSKSFWYQRDQNYMKIVNTLNSAKNLKVEIYGHSCGLSDRTLLKNIFENSNVKKIELFHFGGIDGYVKQSYELWRHFDDSHVYRSKLESYNASNEMPQVDLNIL